MSYPYVYSTDAEIQYDAKGVSMKETRVQPYT